MLRFLVPAAFVAAAVPAVAAADRVAEATARLEAGWAEVAFGGGSDTARIAALDRLLASSEALAREAPGRAEPLAWQGTLLMTKAGIVRGFTGFRLVQQARDRFDRAIAIAPGAAGGLALRQLGVLHYQVPGPPIAFGSRSKARAYIERPLALDPAAPEANLVMADFLAEGGRFADAAPYLDRVLKAPIRADHDAADRGRRAEAEALARLVRARTGAARAG